jgi:P27 family predicted phage terminase small subunit
MSRRGAKPVPTNTKALRGTVRADRGNAHEPEPKSDVPACPSDLSAEAKREWRRVTKELAPLGLLTRIDRAALAAYCQAWATWIEAQAALRQYGVIIKSPSGYPMQSPCLVVANKAFEQMRLMLAEFGMSPRSRTRVHATPPQSAEETALERWERGGEPC